MICLRATLFVALAVFANHPLLDALRGHPNLGSVVVIALMCGLAAYVVSDLWKRYACRRLRTDRISRRPALLFAFVSPTNPPLRSRLAHGMPGRLIKTPEDGASAPQRNAETEDEVRR